VKYVNLQPRPERGGGGKESHVRTNLDTIINAEMDRAAIQIGRIFKETWSRLQEMEGGLTPRKKDRVKRAFCRRFMQVSQGLKVLVRRRVT
jgi:hypothetical protein